jgi:hypothetical protein
VSTPSTPRGSNKIRTHAYNYSIASELEVDAKEAIGVSKVDLVTVVAGHELPITCAEEIVQTISGAWGI